MLVQVWNALVLRPEEMIQRHNDGTFYTHAPTDAWGALSQHVSLANSTKYHRLIPTTRRYLLLL